LTVVPLPVRMIIRVSTRVVPLVNSFQTFVPTGNSQKSMSVVSIFVPGGSWIHRFFVAPSDHSSNCGRYGSAAGLICVHPASMQSPVSASVPGMFGSEASGAPSTVPPGESVIASGVAFGSPHAISATASA
jgi:hypothetical protein